MKLLQSYVGGQWVAGTGSKTALYDAATGEAVAEVAAFQGDYAAILDHARTVGGPALRRLTFAERGAMVRTLGEVIHASRDELIEIGRVNSGNTRGDAKFDVDGASGTLAYYARLGEQLGSKKILLDGEPVPIGRTPRFVGQHVLTPRRGVAIHINAFNFPAWNLAEKAAVALLAGVPVLSKPATSTSWLSARIAELWVASGALPAGAFSLLLGPIGGLLESVTAQDAIVFTGSGDTGRQVRAHPQVLRNSVPVNIEADSLNASVLGPDVEVGSDTFQMFLGDVVRDLTQKAGQKCTAVRRIFVPNAVVDEVTAAIVDRLSTAAVGDPAERGTAVGPLATQRQQQDITHQIAHFSEFLHVAWKASAVPERGWFVAPHLFATDRGLKAPLVHEQEIFGPCATVLAWDGAAAGAVELVAAGGGGLVCSLYSDDEAWAGEVLLGIAPWNGRVMWGSKKVFDQSPGPGTVLPFLTHGGPGKAGGGEELGGERGLRFYWQRTAIQADRSLLDRVLAGWV